MTRRGSESRSWFWLGDRGWTNPQAYEVTLTDVNRILETVFWESRKGEIHWTYFAYVERLPNPLDRLAELAEV